MGLAKCTFDMARSGIALLALAGILCFGSHLGWAKHSKFVVIAGIVAFHKGAALLAINANWSKFKISKDKQWWATRLLIVGSYAAVLMLLLGAHTGANAGGLVGTFAKLPGGPKWAETLSKILFGLCAGFPVGCAVLASGFACPIACFGLGKANNKRGRSKSK